MAKLKRMVLDIMLPQRIDLVKLGVSMADLNSVESVNLMVSEIDQTTVNVKATMEGDALDFKEIHKEIENYGGAIHSIDNVVAGSHVIEHVETPQD